MRPGCCRQQFRSVSSVAPRCWEPTEQESPLSTRVTNPIARIAMLASLVLVCAGPWAAAPARADDLKDGRAALQAGRYDDAIKSFEKAASQGFAAGRAGV